MFTDMRARAASFLRYLWFNIGESGLRFGFLVTAVWLFLVAIFAISSDLSSLKPNELGDFLAGAFAPLAFLWLVITVRLQTIELGLQREELARQADETRALVEQNKLSVEVATKALEQQQRRAREESLHQMIDALAAKIINLAEHCHVVVNGNRSEPFANQRHLRKQAAEGGSRDAIFPVVLHQLVGWLFYVSEHQQKRGESFSMFPSPTLVEETQLLLEKFQELNRILANESGFESVRMRVYAFSLDAYVDALEDVLLVLGQSKTD